MKKVSFHIQKSRLFIILLILFKVGISYSQSYETQRKQLFFYNVLYNGLNAGISGTINKKKDQKVLPIFLKSFAFGCLGGNLKYLAKYQTYYLRNQDMGFYALPNRALFFVGHSIVLNASKNLKPFEHIYFNYLGLNLAYSPKNLTRKLDVKVSLGTAVSVISFLNQKYQLNFFKSMEYGNFYFDFNNQSNLSSRGFALYNAIAIKNFGANYSAIDFVPHETIHTYQKYDFFYISSSYQKPINRLFKKSSLYNKIGKAVSFDYEPLFNRVFYELQPKPLYFKNFFEYEAEHFSSRIGIRR